MTKITLLKSILLAIVLAWSGSALGQDTFTSTGSGNWNTAATWSGQVSDLDGIPDADDNVTIAATHVISLDLDASVNNLNFALATSKINFNIANKTLTVFGNIVGVSNSDDYVTAANGSNATGTKILFSGAGTQVITLIGGSTNWPDFEVNKSGGSLTLSQNTRIDGNLIMTAGTLDAGAKAFSMSPTSNITVAASSSLTNVDRVAQTTGGTAKNNAITIDGLFSTSTGAASINTTTLTVNSTGILDMKGSATGFSNTGGSENPTTMTCNTGCTVKYSGTGQTGRFVNYYNLECTGGTTAGSAVKTISATGTLTINNNLTISNGARFTGGGNYIVTGTTNINDNGEISWTGITNSTFTFNGPLNINGNSANGVIRFGGASTTAPAYTFNGDVTVSAATTAAAFNLNSGTAGVANRTFEGILNFNGNVTAGSGATTLTSVNSTDPPSTNIRFGGTNKSLTLSTGSSFVNLRGDITFTTSRTISAPGGGGFTLTTRPGSVTPEWTVQIDNGTTLTVSSGAYINLPNRVISNGTGAGNLQVDGDLRIGLAGGWNSAITNTGTTTLGSTSTITYNGTSAQVTGSSLPSTVNKLTINNTAGVTLSGNSALNGSLTLTAGTLATGANTLTLNGTTSGSGFINTGATGTLTYNGTSTQTLAAANLTSGAVNNLVVNAGSKLTSSGTIAATNLTLNSSASGTATLVDNGTLTATTANVKQYLPSYRSWYMTSPMTGTSTIPVDNNTLTPALIKLYNETLGDPAGWTTAAGMKGGTGYILNPGTTSGASTLTFTGTLNNGNVPVDLTRSNVTKAGFNLIGNPYPSHIVWTTDMASSANLLPSIWYRTAVYDVDHNVYSFETYNAAGTIAVPTGATPYIPPMQGFWVRVDDAHSTGQLVFTNAMRYHKDANALKAPAVKNTENKVLRLQVTGGNLTDEAVVYFNSNATNAFDMYDSQKMLNGSNSSIHDIYTSADTEKLVINGLKEIAYDTEIPLHIQVNASNATAFTLKANEISNFDAGTPVYIKNNTTGMQQLISDGSIYDFSRTEIGVEPAFSLLIKAPGTTTSFAKTETDNVQIFVNANRQIVIKNPNATKNAVASVYNSVGQLLVNEHVTGNVFVMDKAFVAGVYYVKVNGVSSKVIVK